ncbi:hypothetical protein CEXT_735911 [Caerostris extrusa]|uniref:Neurotransmitter-gated ion-channel ligand-binding domain-containing protein n=1 Tax=Caerostris extrusa TaxID=172846 RepID=A0AAV4Y394_CAEEX|nr:hypothetical protein CEXT_735911 [Caerostris extrusa]
MSALNNALEVKNSSSKALIFELENSNLNNRIATRSLQGPHEKRLLTDLLTGYNVLERPVANETEPLLLSFGLTLQQIIDVESSSKKGLFSLMKISHPSED